MPVYQYSCVSCEATLEVRQRFNDEPLTECPSCGGRMRRLFQPVGIIFKGSGWYCTDNRPKSNEAKGGDAETKKEADKS